MLLNDGFCLRLNENTVISKIYGAHSLILLGVNLIPLSHLYQRKREMPCLFDVIGKVCTYGDDTNYSIQYPKYITINDFTLSKYQNDVHILMTADIYDNFCEFILNDGYSTLDVILNSYNISEIFYNRIKEIKKYTDFENMSLTTFNDILKCDEIII